MGPSAFKLIWFGSFVLFETTKLSFEHDGHDHLSCEGCETFTVPMFSEPFPENEDVGCGSAVVVLTLVLVMLVVVVDVMVVAATRTVLTLTCVEVDANVRLVVVVVVSVIVFVAPQPASASVAATAAAILALIEPPCRIGSALRAVLRLTLRNMGDFLGVGKPALRSPAPASHRVDTPGISAEPRRARAPSPQRGRIVAMSTGPRY